MTFTIIGTLMNFNRLFKLDNRLLACCNFIKPHAKIADIGTDHAYLPIWLMLNDRIDHAIACDLRHGPLLNAENNIKKYNLESKIETRLSDGLENVSKDEVDTVIIAGMGGEIITQIIKSAKWLKDYNKSIILQPMSNDESLRIFLKNEGFEIIEEIAVLSHNKIYSVMNIRFSNNKFITDNLYEFIGKINPIASNDSFIYINKKISSLNNRILGFNPSSYEYKHIHKAIEDLKNILKENDLNDNN